VHDLLAKPPHRGEGLNNWLFRVARVLHPYRNPTEIFQLLEAATYGEPVKPGEIERAIENSKQYAWQPGQPQQVVRTSAWPKVNVEQREAVTTSGAGLVDLWEISPVRIEDSHPHTEEIIDALFPGDPLLCCGLSMTDFDTRSREEWRGQLRSLQFIVPSPMTARIGKTREGKESAHALSITGPRRFLVIEQDKGTIDEQSALLLHLAGFAPMALAVHSGNKSIHGWFYCVRNPENDWHRFMRYAVSLGADPALWTPSQFTRMPDGRRDKGKRQTVYFFNPGVIK
jgi:hypothetical protein